MTPQQKIKQALDLEQAIRQGKAEFVLLKKLDMLEDKIESIVIPEVDLTGLEKEIQDLKDEEIEVTLEIV